MVGFRIPTVSCKYSGNTKTDHSESRIIQNPVFLKVNIQMARILNSQA